LDHLFYPYCEVSGELTPLFPPAPEDEAIWTRVTRLASVPFSATAALDADQGRPVMITQAVSEQVAAYELVAARIRDALDGGPGRAELN
jgi:hypothetical protein